MTGKRGRPAGSCTVVPTRDLRIHFVVEWVILMTHLPLGRGGKAGDEFDACEVASWLLSCPGRQPDTPVWKRRIWSWWQHQRIMYRLDPTDVPHPDEPIYLSPASVRDAYQRVAASGAGEAMRRQVLRMGLRPQIIPK
jgi:hypothetical protein